MLLPHLSQDEGILPIVVAALAILVAASVVTYVNYSSPPAGRSQEPLIGNIQLRSDSVDIAGLNSTDLSLDFRAVLYNPNVFGASLEVLNYSIYANGHYLGRGQTARGFDLAPRSTESLAFPIVIGWRSAFETVGEYVLGLGHVTWQVKGTAEIKLGEISLAAPFEFAVG